MKAISRKKAKGIPGMKNISQKIPTTTWGSGGGGPPPHEDHLDSFFGLHASSCSPLRIRLFSRQIVGVVQ